MVRVLFVCLGNICRSPTAHGVFAHLVKSSGLNDKVTVDSAGTAGWHIGAEPDKRSQAVAAQRGYDLSELQARQVSLADFIRFDYILAMDEQNLQDLKLLRPENYKGCLKLFLSFDQCFAETEVPDPYYGGDQGFEHVVDLIEAAAQALLNDIQLRHLKN